MRERSDRAPVWYIFAYLSDPWRASIIADLQNGSAEDRRRLAVYCLKDAHLPLVRAAYDPLAKVEFATVFGDLRW